MRRAQTNEHSNCRFHRLTDFSNPGETVASQETQAEFKRSVELLWAEPQSGHGYSGGSRHYWRKKRVAGIAVQLPYGQSPRGLWRKPSCLKEDPVEVTAR